MWIARLTELQSVKLIECLVPTIMLGNEDIRAGAFRNSLVTLGGRAPQSDTFDFRLEILESTGGPTPEYAAHMPLIAILQR